jgi:hypothetical protein
VADTDDDPEPKSGAFERYRELDDLRRALPADADHDAAVLLNEMQAVWPQLAPAEQEWLEYKSLRQAAARGGDTLTRKLAQVFGTAAARERAERELARYGEEAKEREKERVRLAALKLSAGDLDRLAVAVDAAKQGYRALLRQAEHPVEEYWDWLRR